MVALSGAGKGVWLSNYIRWRKDYEPNLLVYWIDPKNDPKESGYFDESWIRAYRFRAIDLSVEDLISELQAAFRGYLGFIANLLAGHPVLLIVDECLMVQFNLDEHGRNKSERGTLKTQIVSAASVGDSDNKHIVCVSQSPNAGDSGVSGGVLRGLRKVVLFRGDELDVVHQAKLCGAIDDLPSDADLRRLCRRSARNRGIYLNGQYYSLPELPNYSGYDRDRRSWTDSSKQPVNRLEKQLGELIFEANPTLNGAPDLLIEAACLPTSIPAAAALQAINYLIDLLLTHKSELPIAQATLAGNDTKLKKIKAKLGSEDWIRFLEYWAEQEKIVLEKSAKGIKITLPPDEEEEAWEAIFSC